MPDELNYTYIKDIYGSGPVTLKIPDPQDEIDRKESYDPSGKFQRTTTYKSGLIVHEEMADGKLTFKFNRPFVEDEPGVLFFY